MFRLSSLFLVVYFISTTVQGINSFYPPVETCMTDMECEIAYEMEDNTPLPIATWSDWADAGCTEESRTKNKQFDTLCTAFEQTHQYH